MWSLAIRFLRRSMPLAGVLGCALLGGCVAKVSPRTAGGPSSADSSVDPTTQPALLASLSHPQWSPELQAMIIPPIGWEMSVLPGKFDSHHQVWISPSGRTAYGVIRFSLPLPIPHEPVLWVFIREVRRNEGQADLVDKQWDSSRRGLRAVVEGGRYTIRTTITVRGLSGWITYAGTLRHEPVDGEELDRAQAARDRTRVGRRDE